MAEWYERQHELEEGQVFRMRDGSVVKLERAVPGDGTAWFAADWYNGHWTYDDTVIEPGDLIELLPGDPQTQPPAQ